MIPRVNHRVYSNYLDSYRSHATEPIVSKKLNKRVSIPCKKVMSKSRQEALTYKSNCILFKTGKFGEMFKPIQSRSEDSFLEDDCNELKELDEVNI